MRKTISRLAIVLAAALLPVLAHAEDAATRHKPTQSESYVMVQPLYASILDGAKPRGLLLVEMGIDVPNPQLRARVNQYMPLLRDAYVRSLSLYAANAVRTWRQPDVEDIASRMQKITDKVLHQEGAKVLMAQTAIRVTH